MNLYFITGNKEKFKEVKSFIASMEQLDLDLAEIQELDPKKIIEEKLKATSLQHKGGLIIEDTSLCFDAFNGLPGPLIKWFLKSIGNEGLARLAKSLSSNAGRAITWLGYKNSKGYIQYFKGEIKGHIVLPRGMNGFGWDAIFQPLQSTKTFAEMSFEEKMTYSMRRIAIQKLKKYIDKD